jgi:hypothetical protein
MKHLVVSYKILGLMPDYKLISISALHRFSLFQQEKQQKGILGFFDVILTPFPLS